jgi:hypothetical protein
MQTIYKPLTEQEKAWIKEFFNAEMNATEATRKVYGGTQSSCKVKGHKKFKKLRELLTEIQEREFYQMEFQGITGIDFYLGNLQRQLEKYQAFDSFLRKGLRG